MIDRVVYMVENIFWKPTKISKFAFTFSKKWIEKNNLLKMANFLQRVGV